MNSEIEAYVIEFLKTQEKELRQNDLNSVYDNIIHFRKPVSQTNITIFLKSKGVEPLKYFKEEIPPYFAYTLDSYKGDLKISKDIRKIGSFSFCETDIEKLYIPSSVQEIGICAFAGCEKLKEVYIDGCPLFRPDAFRLHKRVDFKMNCSKKQFDKVNSNQLDKYKQNQDLDIQFLK